MEGAMAVSVRRAASLTAVAVATALGVLVLPWFIPVPLRPIDSLSQTVGFSNRTSIVCAVVGALALAVIAYATRTAPSEPFVSTDPAEKRLRLGRPVIATVAAGSAAVVMGMGALLRGPRMDATYFVDRMLLVVNGSLPYRQFEFSYGPLMLYPQSWLYLALHHIGASANVVFYLWLATAQAIGVILAAFVIDRLSIASRSVRIWLLVALVVVDAPLLSLNQSLVRSVLPYAVLLGLLGFARRRGFTWHVAVLSLGSVVLIVLFSPEQGIALLTASFAALALAAWRGMPGSRLALGVLATGGAAIAWGASRFPMVAWSAAGVYNLPAYPGTPEAVFLVALFVVAIGIGSELRLTDLDHAPLLVGWFVLALVLVSPALSRPDGMHVFIQSFGLLFGAAAIASRRRLAGLWIALAAIGFALVTYTWSVYNIVSFAAGAKEGDSVEAPSPEIEKADFDALSGLSNVTVIGNLSGRLGEELALGRALVPLYGLHMYTAGEVKRTLNGISNAKYALMPNDQYEIYAAQKQTGRTYYMKTPQTSENAQWTFRLYGIPLTVEQRQPALDGPRSLYLGVLARFRFERQLGAWTLLKRK
jgi:hypothetical protein